MKKVNSSQLMVHRKKHHRTIKTVNRELITINSNGQIIIVGIIFLAVVLTMASSLFSRVSNFMSFSSASVVNEQATNLAEAGLEKALWQLNQTAGSYTGEANTTLGTSGTFTVSVANNGSNLKTITSTGFVPNSTKPRSKRTIKVDTAINSQVVSFNYAVQVGTGGLTMNNSSSIQGNVYSNGSVTGTGTSFINGDVWSVGTISSPNPIVAGVKNPGSPPSQMPTLDYQYWKDAATAGGIINCVGTCDITSNTTIGPKQYIGNLKLSSNAVVTLNGPIYVTGDFETVNSAKLNLNNSFGSNGTVLIVNGSIRVSNSGALNPTNANPPGYILAVTTSTASDAIIISNSAEAALFYALEGGAQISNSGEIIAIVAKSLTINNNSELQYHSGLASANFTSGPGASWLMKKGTYKFSNQ